MLVGREPVCDLITERLADLATGAGSVVVVEGEPGMGKSAILRVVADQAGGRDVDVFEARGEPFHSTRPFGLIDDALGEASLLDEAVSLRGQVERVADLVEAVSLGQPTVLLLDDAQWSDVPSMLVILELLRRGLNAPTLVVLAVRPVWRTSPVARSLAAVRDSAALVDLEPLSNDAVIDLAVALGAPIDDDIRERLERAGGNPFLVEEVVSVGSRTATGDPSGAIADRFDLIDTETSELVRMASALGRSFRVNDLAALTHRPVAALVGPMRQAELAGILEDADEAGEPVLRFRHDVLRDALYDALPHAFRAALQLEISQLLADRGSSPTDLAARLAPETGSDADAAELLGRAARAICYYQPAEAVPLLERALPLAGPADRDWLLVDLLQARSWAGDLEDALTFAEDQLRFVVDPTARALVLIDIVRNNMALGRVTPLLEEAVIDSLALLDRRIDGGTSGDAEERDPLSAVGELSYALLTFGDAPRAAMVARRVNELAAAVGSSAGMVTAGVVLAMCSALDGYWDAAIELVTRIAAQARSERALMRYGVDGLAAFLLSLAGRDDEAEEHRLLHTASWAASDGLSRAVTPVVEAMLALHAGLWDDVHTAGQAYLTALDEDGFRNNILFMQSALALASIHRGDLEDAERRVRDARDELSTRATVFGADWVMRAGAQLDAARGDVDGALAGFGTILDLAEGTDSYGIPVPALIDMALLAHRFEKHDVLERLGRVAQAISKRSRDAPYINAVATVCRGDATSAVEQLRKLNRPLELARALEISALQHRDDPTSGAHHLDEALAIYERLEAQQCIETARASADMLQVYIRRRTGVAKYASGWKALTPTEWRVVRLVAQGRSNIEIAELLGNSRRTIEAHLRQVFAKLDVPNRLALATKFRDEVADQPTS